jgi:uncharacterized protein YukE
MSSQVLLSAEAVQNVRNALKKQQNDLQQLKDQVTQIKNRIDGAWDSSANPAFLEDFRKFELTLLRAVGICNGISKGLQFGSESIITSDENIKREFEKIPEAGIIK